MKTATLHRYELPMNSQRVLFHLREAHYELIRTISHIECDPHCPEVEFEAAMEYIYRHLNTAWNARNADSEPAAASDAWRAFPVDISLRACPKPKDAIGRSSDGSSTRR